MLLDFDDIALRLSAATLMGVLIGINRDLHLQNKPIGALTLGSISASGGSHLLRPTLRTINPIPRIAARIIASNRMVSRDAPNSLYAM